MQPRLLDQYTKFLGGGEPGATLLTVEIEHEQYERQLRLELARETALALGADLAIRAVKQSCGYRKYVSKSKGRGRLRKRWKEFEWLYYAGEWINLSTAKGRARADDCAHDLLNGIVDTYEHNLYDVLLELVREHCGAIKIKNVDPRGPKWIWTKQPIES